MNGRSDDSIGFSRDAFKAGNNADYGQKGGTGIDFSMPPCLRGEALLNLDVAGSGPYLQQRAAAADFAANRFTGFLHPSLHCHFDGRAHVHGARTGGNVGVERRIRRQLHAYVARTGTNFPVSALLAFRGDVAAAGLAMERALYAAGSDAAGTGMKVDVART